MKPAMKLNQPRLFVLPDEEAGQLPPAVPPNYDELTAYRQLRDLAAEAQQVRDRLFVDLPPNGRGYERQALRAKRALDKYHRAWCFANAAGFGDTVAERIAWERQKPRKIIPFPVRL